MKLLTSPDVPDLTFGAPQHIVKCANDRLPDDGDRQRYYLQRLRDRAIDLLHH